jgi:phosphoribosylglycinamide formyltransferase 1
MEVKSNARIPIAVLVSGSGTNLQALIDAQERESVAYSIQLVVSNESDAFALQRAQLAGISSVVVNHQDYASRQQFDEALAGVIEGSRVQFVVLAGFMRRLSPSFVERFFTRLINIHPSLLPAHPGLNTHRKALAAGDLEHGCSIHYVTEVLDGGPVIAQFALSVLPGDDEESLQKRVLQLEHRWLWRVLNQIVLGHVKYMEGVVLYRGVINVQSPEEFFCS